MINRLRELLRYDNVAQAAVAFLIGVLVVAPVVVAIGLTTVPFPVPLSAEERGAARVAGETRGRYLAALEAAERVAQYGPRYFDDDFADVLKTGSRADGYALAYRDAWNDAVNQLSRRVPRQLLAREQHTQWIELLR